ncbi:MAG: glycine cleavage system aminomethyltransferase GcvT [Chloroflexi bacterium]|nr:glycine cleavage system aminomethyltransferase GcvT [Chloroflexota bacterium]
MTLDRPSDAGLLETALHERHVAAGARMVDFGGWDMPIQYGSIRAEHTAVRTAVGVFDLSHMGRLYVHGAQALDLVQGLTVNDAGRLAVGRAQYSLICGDDGRILDDILVYNLGDQYLLVVNASNRLKLLEWIEERRQGPLAGLDATVEDATFATVMIGFQGPASAALLQLLADVSLDDLRYYAAIQGTVAGRSGLIARTGYTGEDGFEVIVSRTDGEATWDTLLEARAGVTPMACGLGARDTLRLEAGMPLYGHEIDESHNPYEARLGRVVKLDKGPFAGRDALRQISEHGADRTLIAFELTAGGVPRQGYPISIDGVEVGQVTSGNVSPSLGTPIGMAYVPTLRSEVGTELAVIIRGKPVPGRIVSLPFYEHRTRRGTPSGASRG